MLLLALGACLLCWWHTRSAWRQMLSLQQDLQRLEWQFERFLQEGLQPVNQPLRLLQEASHDLRARLHAVQMLAWQLQLESPAACGEVWRKLLRAIDGLQQFTRQFLQFSRLQHGLPALEMQRFHLQDVLQQLELEFEQVALEANLRLDLRACDVWLETDRELLLRTLENLLGNALKFARRRILLAVRRRRSGLWIEVRDDGPGIAPAQREQIFAAFSHQRAGNPDGVGLGLSIVLRLLQALGGRLELQSHPGRGSLFRVWLPLSCVSAAPAPAYEDSS
ncbi:HAMP domain-containing sensor histidine kinase [Massilia sp. W12]|uniref:sensor histidine kinase n=1 Tax=Massilia sp. W12 TaxID=3126507 RepID=UPI0030D222E2